MKPVNVICDFPCVYIYVGNITHYFSNASIFLAESWNLIEKSSISRQKEGRSSNRTWRDDVSVGFPTRKLIYKGIKNIEVPTNSLISGADYIISVSNYIITTTDYKITGADYRISRYLRKNYSERKSFFSIEIRNCCFWI